MKIVADRNLALLTEDIPPGIKIERVEGREISTAHLQDADVLLVRSVTVVNAALLDGSTVRFIGTATAGINHLDLDYLKHKGIAWCSAPGSNADAVVDYCLAALAHAELTLGMDIQSSAIGIVGAGNVGSRLARRLQSLGCDVILNDPPLQDEGRTEVAGIPLQSLDAIANCQIISLHMPFTEQGAHPTHNLIDAAFLSHFLEGSLLINSCRGEVIEERALKAIVSSAQMHTVIDVWRGEPMVDRSLAQNVTLATPHIAGYSSRAKRNAVRQILPELWRFAQAEGLIESIPEPGATADTAVGEDLVVDAKANCWQVVRQVLPLHSISETFKQSLAHNQPENGFDAMRRQLQQRREFSEYRIAAENLSPKQANQFAALGFQLLR